MAEITTPALCVAQQISPFHELVGSGEQSLLSMWINNEVLPTRIVTCTPCFRDEPVINEATRPYFMKVELMVRHSTDFMSVLYDAMLAFRQEGCSPIVVPTKDGMDLYLNGYEIGSYGTRTHNGYTWAYGTGVAEPRFSVALNND